MKHGTLYGVGVGPGDPELLTLKAIRILHNADKVYAAHSTKNDHSIAHSIVAPHLREGMEIKKLGFPMSRDANELREAWEQNARQVLTDIEAGKNVCFLTLGDPLTYSTFGYLMKTVQALNPDTDIQAVPGITSFNAAAAASLTLIGEKEETFAVVSGADGGEHLNEALSTCATVAVLKTYRQFEKIRRVVLERGLEKNAVLVSHCGQPGETIVRDISSLDNRPPYLSILLVRK